MLVLGEDYERAWIIWLMDDKVGEDVFVPY